MLPSIIAAGPAWLLAATGALDLEAAMAPTLVAKLTASLLVALAVACAFLIARARTSAGLAVLVALGYGFGTNVWLAGQTLGGHETVALGLTAALALLTPPDRAAARLAGVGRHGDARRRRGRAGAGRAGRGGAGAVGPGSGPLPAVARPLAARGRGGDRGGATTSRGSGIRSVPLPASSRCTPRCMRRLGVSGRRGRAASASS